jgi:hypothetical protein
MVTIFSGIQLMCLDYLPRGQKYNKLYFKDVILDQTDRGLNRGREQSRTKSARIHMDNARVHAAGDCIAEIQHLKMTRLPQPAYSPDLSLCDFWFFGFVKQAIQDEVLAMLISSCNAYIQFSIRPLLRTCSGSSLIGWRDQVGRLSTMVPTFKSKTLITGLYLMNPPDSKGVLLFTTLYHG